MELKFASWAAAEKDKKRLANRIAAQCAMNRRIADRIKIESGCIDCGYKAHPLALQFDHRDGVEKKGDVSYLVRRMTRTMLAEIAKCDVRCANCHSIRTTEKRHHRKQRKASTQVAQFQAKLIP